MDRTAVVEEDDARRSATSNIVPCLSETERLLSAQVDDLKHIHSLSLRLAGADTLAEVLIDVLRTAAQLVNASLGSVQLLTPDGKLGMLGQIGFGDSILDQFAVVGLEDCSTCAAALNRRCRVIVRDLRADPTFTEIAAALRDYGAVAAVSTPILDKAGNVLAMFSLYWPDEHEPDERELGTLDLCAELAGRHVERSVAAKMLRDHHQRQALLMRELAHRGKNLLSIIQSIAAHSLRGERTLDEARDVFIGRLGALANTYNTLTDEAPESVQLHDIVSADLKLYSERVTIRGPAIALPARNAQTLALAIHELTTNAAKYGALASPSGRIEVAWGIAMADSEEERFTLDWLEIGDTPVEPPGERGFGSALLTSVIGNELKCVPSMQFSRDGFRYHLECPWNSLIDSPTQVA